MAVKSVSTKPLSALALPQAVAVVSVAVAADTEVSEVVTAAAVEDMVASKAVDMVARVATAVNRAEATVDSRGADMAVVAAVATAVSQIGEAPLVDNKEVMVAADRVADTKSPSMKASHA